VHIRSTFDYETHHSKPRKHFFENTETRDMSQRQDGNPCTTLHRFSFCSFHFTIPSELLIQRQIRLNFQFLFFCLSFKNLTKSFSRDFQSSGDCLVPSCPHCPQLTLIRLCECIPRRMTHTSVAFNSGRRCSENSRFIAC
jgi:hypothetical protein